MLLTNLMYGSESTIDRVGGNGRHSTKKDIGIFSYLFLFEDNLNDGHVASIYYCNWGVIIGRLLHQSLIVNCRVACGYIS